MRKGIQHAPPRPALCCSWLGRKRGSWWPADTETQPFLATPHITSTPSLLRLFSEAQGEYLSAFPQHPPWPTKCLCDGLPPAPSNTGEPHTSPASDTEPQSLGRAACSRRSSAPIQGTMNYYHFHSSILTKLYARHGLGTKEHKNTSFPQRSFY